MTKKVRRCQVLSLSTPNLVCSLRSQKREICYGFSLIFSTPVITGESRENGGELVPEFDERVVGKHALNYKLAYSDNVSRFLLYHFPRQMTM